MRGWRRRRRSGCSTCRWRACCPATVGSRRRPTGGSGLPSPGGLRWGGRCGAWHAGWTMAELQPAVMARIRRHVASHAQFPDAATLGVLVREGGGVLGQEDLAALPGKVRAELLGAGPLQVLLDTPGVSDVLVNGPHEVWLDRGTGLELTDVTVSDVRGLAVRMAAAGGRPGGPHADGRRPAPAPPRCTRSVRPGRPLTAGWPAGWSCRSRWPPTPAGSPGRR